jgi:chromosome segregation ATPase
MQKVAQFSNEVTEFDNFKREVNTLKSRLSEKEEEIKIKDSQLEEKENENRLLIARFSEKAAQWHKDKEQHKSDLKSVKIQYHESSSREVQAARKKTEQAQAKEQEKDKTLRQALANLTISEQKFERCQSDLYELKSHIGFIKCDDNLLVSSHFSNTHTE